MVDFSNIKNEDKILEKLKTLKRQGQWRAQEFPPIEVEGFMIKVTAVDIPQKNQLHGLPWSPKELDALKKIHEIQVNISLYEKRPGTDIYNKIVPKTHKDFESQNWAKNSNFEGNIRSNANTLVEIIRYIQVFYNCTAFL